MQIKSLTVAEVAQYLQLADKTVRSKVARGEIPRIKDIGEIRIPHSYIDYCELNAYENGTFAERKLKEIIDQKNEEIRRLKSIIKDMIKIGIDTVHE